MIAPALFLVAALAAPPQEVAETPSSAAARTPSPEEALGSARTPLLIPGVAQRPAELVAARVRRVLLSNSDDAWFELADALPELALAGGADLTTTFEAARLAERAGSTVATRRSGARAWAASVTRTQWIIFLLGVFTLPMVALTLLRRHRAPATSVRFLVRSTGARNGVTSRFADARQLATAGLAVSEIAQRTGMARDAVTLLVGLSSR